jgi:hypothetical protein
VITQDLTEAPARIDSGAYSYAQFPPLKDLPDTAHEPIEAVMALRTRKADVQIRRSEAHQELEAARRADVLALKDHVAAGGSSSTFQGSAPSVEQDIRHLDADLQAIDQLLREQYVRTCKALQAVVDEGVDLARRNTSNAQKRYANAINELEAARQSYLASCGVELFWRYLMAKGDCVVQGGDQIVMRRGLITKVDSTTVRLLRDDAQTHERAREATI